MQRANSNVWCSTSFGKNYIETLVQKGYKVAVCEQTEDPKQAKGVVKREVVQLITPGTIMEGKSLDGKTNHFIGAAEQFDDMTFGYAYLDLSTGEAVASSIEGDGKALLLQMQAYGIRELIVTESLQLLLAEHAVNAGIVLSIETDEMTMAKAAHYLDAVPNDLQIACLRLLAYIDKTQMRSLSHIQAFTYNEMKNYLRIDSSSKRNLELIQSIRGGDQKAHFYGC